MKKYIEKIIILMEKDDNEISKDLFDALSKVVKKIFNLVSFNICYEIIEERFIDLIYKFIADFKINSLSADSKTDINSREKFKTFLKEKKLIWNKLEEDKKIKLLVEYKSEVIAPQIYAYLQKSVKHIIINYKKEIEDKIYVSNFDERNISIYFQEELDYRKRLKELVDGLEYISLRKDEKEFIYLMYNNGDIRKAKEIAEILKISVQAVHKRITRNTKHYQEINQR